VVYDALGLGLLVTGRPRVGVGRRNKRDIMMGGSLCALGGCDSGSAPCGGPMLAAWRRVGPEGSL
jgi:hypothetical protein